MPRAFRDTERQRIRHRLVECGKRLINRVGTKSLTVDEVSRESGISKGSFYSFFPSREEFILSVFESWEEEHRSTLFRGVLESEGTPRERLARFFLGAFAILDKEPGLARLGAGEIERIREGIPPERLAAHQAADGRAFSEAISGWAERGIIRPSAVEDLPGIGAALFVIAIHKEDFPPGSYERTVRTIAEALALRIAPPERGEPS